MTDEIIATHEVPTPLKENAPSFWRRKAICQKNIQRLYASQMRGRTRWFLSEIGIAVSRHKEYITKRMDRGFWDFELVCNTDMAVVIWRFLELIDTL